MKKLLLSCGGLFLVSAALSAQTPEYFSSDFEAESSISSEWVQYGAESSPEGSYAEQFPNYGPGHYYSLVNLSGDVAACSPSQFASGTSDQWLITPEILIEDDLALLNFTAYVLGNNTRNRYKVLVSEGGAEQADFTKELVSATITGQSAALASANRSAVLENYKGKNVRLAFVNSGNSAGIMGFGDIKLGQYNLSYDAAAIEHYVVTGESVNPEFVIRLSTPVAAKGVTAELTTENGYSSLFTSDYSFGPNMAGSHTIAFPDAFELGSKSKVAFTLTVTPNFDGARPTVLEGYFYRAPFAPVALMEDYTGTWCQNCPRGIAFLSYYSHNYGRSAGEGNFIGVSVHVDDVMANDVYTQLNAIWSAEGIPTAILNRSKEGDPATLDVKAVLEENSPVELRISKVDLADDAFTVNYAVATCYDTENADFKVFAYLLENDLIENNAQYVQKTAYGIYNEEYIAETYGEALVPYFANFINRPYGIVPPAEMPHNEIARGVYPDITGGLFGGAMQSCLYKEDSLSFRMPETVVNKDKVVVAVLLTDANSGKVLAGDQLPRDRFNELIYAVSSEPVYPEGFDPTPSLVNEVSAEISIELTNGQLQLTAPEAGYVTVHAVDGTCLYASPVKEGVTSLNLNYAGPVIVKLTTPTAVAVAKYLL